MSQLSILRRHISILRKVQPPFRYPNKQAIIDGLLDEGIDTSTRTFERDIQEIETLYGIRLKYCHRRKGYFLHQPEDEDISDFKQFLRLLERCERLAILTHSSDALQTGKYILLEESDPVNTFQHFPIIWECLRKQQQLNFRYQPFKTNQPKKYIVDPLVIMEFRNRWYLGAWDIKDNRFKTFGIERMLEAVLSKIPVSGDRRSQFIALKDTALGVSFGMEDSVDDVTLLINVEIAPYIRTVPIHESQKIIKEEDGDITIQLQLIINAELEREILGYGEMVEVMEPDWLRKRIRERADKLLEKYSKINSIN